MVHSSPINTKSRDRQSQACNLHTTHLGILKLHPNEKMIDEADKLMKWHEPVRITI